MQNAGVSAGGRGPVCPSVPAKHRGSPPPSLPPRLLCYLPRSPSGTRGGCASSPSPRSSPRLNSCRDSGGLCFSPPRDNKRRPRESRRLNKPPGEGGEGRRGEAGRPSPALPAPLPVPRAAPGGLLWCAPPSPCQFNSTGGIGTTNTALPRLRPRTSATESRPFPAKNAGSYFPLCAYAARPRCSKRRQSWRFHGFRTRIDK